MFGLVPSVNENASYLRHAVLPQPVAIHVLPACLSRSSTSGIQTVPRCFSSSSSLRSRSNFNKEASPSILSGSHNGETKISCIPPTNRYLVGSTTPERFTQWEAVSTHRLLINEQPQV
ncbi:hypothetical protein BLOT_004893 [Blomia tropicalis]|nr:hypothetical protein BLOT_004893 [Blomia tropicalis]